MGLLFLSLGLYTVPAIRRPIRNFLKNGAEGFSWDLSLLNPTSKKHEFKKEMKAALADGVLTDDEARTLERKAEELGISDEYINKLRHEDFAKRIKPIISRIETTHRFSPDDEAELKTMAGDLKIASEFGGEFQMFRDLWTYENEGRFDLEPIDVPILTGANEECYFEAPAIWRQIKTVSKHRGYVGGSVGFRVAKGVRFSVGRAVPVRDVYEEMQDISGGEIYVTNKKIVFNGSRKSTNVTMGRIVQLELYNDGIEIRKSTGKPDFFKMAGVHAEYLAAIVHNMMNKN
ncbi:MAG: hypothetical protein H6855_00220 [Rhodospirillales bacterium]|nr:hypothetical protein [Rhodospirillales bacterium]